jgi:hypothetical protein
MSVPCPNPGKIPYDSADLARREASHLERGTPKVYRCRCGSFHVTTISPTRLRRMRATRRRTEPIRPGSTFDATYTPNAGEAGP